ncbi:hypothetical protein SLEP1_g53263 [Rubroshorea leprosula]|uniref:Uncharacterized protein n=1 Tax=Rubroshorea leprosula TaxID=152421 RepID=A0AAV5MCF6_9ROSI|nr:hypothetical protein SLEP1_g53263 [Rubroshorea leprosula]
MAEGGEETDDEQDVRYCPKEKGREGRLHMIRKVGQIRSWNAKYTRPSVRCP